MSSNLWDQILDRLHAELDSDEYRRWFAPTAYASDSGDQVTVWVHSESARRHILSHFQHSLDRALVALDRPDTEIRFVVAGYSEEEDAYE
jgi:chromosomal replication initiation ATPase DnaA